MLLPVLFSWFSKAGTNFGYLARYMEILIERQFILKSVAIFVILHYEQFLLEHIAKTPQSDFPESGLVQGTLATQNTC